MAAVYQKIIQYIDAHIKGDITVAEIADFAGYSANHVYKIFGQYSPYPIMEYIRRKKIYFASNEMYTGRKLYDIALDYGFETPAGFYKAFKTIFGCSPSEYQNNLMREGKNMFIDNIKTVDELDAVLEFANSIYAHLNLQFMFGNDDDKCTNSRSMWLEQFKKTPELLLYAKDECKICGIALGGDYAMGHYLTVEADGVLPGCKNKGVHEALFVEIEKRAKQLGCKGIVLGINEGEEEFYAKMGYTGKTLIQSEKYSVDELKEFNKKYGGHEVVGTNIYDGYVNQLWLNSSLLDKGLKARFEDEVGDCWVQIIVNKELI